MPQQQGTPDEGAVLVLNCGSSSVKLALVDPVSGRRRLSCLAERVGTPDALVRTTRHDGGGAGAGTAETRPEDTSPRGVLAAVLAEVGDDVPLLGAGHRVVHGGDRFSSSVRVDDDVLAGIREVGALAPLHNPANLAGIEAVRELLPGLGNVAVFDTAFHQSMPERAFRYAVPEQWYADHQVRRYGFHGTSVRFVSARAADLLQAGRGEPAGPLRLVVAHLGNGCSATAVLDGRSVDTTMGLTPLEGLVMGTRSGDVDPGALAHVAARTGAGVEELVGQLNSRSGLLGLSGLGNDVRTLVQAADRGHPGARLALDVFAYRLAKHVGALLVPLGGLDALVLTGGIGENAVGVRSRLLALLGHLGLVEDAAANAVHGRGAEPAGRISAARQAGPVALVVPTDEEWLIARDTADLVAGAAPARTALR
ncbi:acetate/propionate family kinase [Kineococcus glutinatus]|uniref:Acetate kinase n=1 Tax=Kineococcus glutinatus TaxID=1070872 RepID=A0ABP9H8D7_9ACTN